MNIDEVREALSIIKSARGILDKTYVQWYQDNGKGGHCAVGSVANARGLNMTGSKDPAVQILSETAKALYPELRGKTASRLSFTFTLCGGLCSTDYFDECPILYVNNHLGKEETLRIFDLTIAELELRVAALEAQAQPELEEVACGR